MKKVVLIVTMALLLVFMFVSFVVAQDGDNEQVPETEKAQAAEQAEVTFRATPAQPTPPAGVVSPNEDAGLVGQTPSGGQEIENLRELLDHHYPLFVGVDDATVPAYRIDPMTDEVILAFSGVEVWGAAYDYQHDRILFSDGIELYEWPVGGAPVIMGVVSDTTNTTVAMEGLAFLNDTLYASKVSSTGEGEGIYTIDLNTLQATRAIAYADNTVTIGGIDADPVTGKLYGVNDGTALRGLVEIDPDGTVSLVAPYVPGETDVDGLAVGDGKAYLITDDTTPRSFSVFDFSVMTYTGVVTNPWTTTEVFAAGAWIETPFDNVCTVGTWQPIDSVNTGRSRPGLAYSPFNGRFYLAGGEATGGNRDIPIEEYNPVTDEWTDKANLSIGVANTGAVGVGQHIYVPGGFTGVGGIDTMQRYDIEANVVVTMTAMPAPNFAHGVVAMDDRIYVLGGDATGQVGTTNYIYDIAGNYWITGTAMLTATRYPAAVTDGSYIYVAGGNTTNIPTVQRYNPATDMWDTIPEMNTGRGGPSAFFDGVNLWAVGGGWSSYHTTTEFWDGISWQYGPPMGTGVRTLGAAFGDDMAIKAAGWNGDFAAEAERLDIQCSPRIVVDELSLESTQRLNTFVTDTLTIQNTGVVDLDWTIVDDATSISWMDDFDDYDSGSELHHQGGWKGWSDFSAFTAYIVDIVSLSPPNVMESAGTTDMIREFSGYTSGKWELSVSQYIPSSFSGNTYFILLNQYADAGPFNWSTQVVFDSSTGQVNNSGTTGGALLYLTDQWVELRVEIDLDNDIQEFYYDNQLLYSGTWTEEVSGGGALQFAAISVFANGASPVYYDDFVLSDAQPSACVGQGGIPWASALPMSGITSPAGLSSVDVIFNSTGMTPGVHTGMYCIQSNDPATPEVAVPVTMTVTPYELHLPLLAND